jgi:hypothetical protein
LFKGFAIFVATSVYEVVDLENTEAAIIFLKETYDNPEPWKINRYLRVVGRLREIETGQMLSG